MFAKEKLLDDIAKVAGGTVSAVTGLHRQIKDEVRARVDETAQRLDLVPREEFEKLEAMLVKAREEQDSLIKRVTELEKQLRTKAPAKKKPSGKAKKKTT
jgi:BMFP domain-containing protein YqiC